MHYWRVSTLRRLWKSEDFRSWGVEDLVTACPELSMIIDLTATDKCVLFVFNLMIADSSNILLFWSATTHQLMWRKKESAMSSSKLLVEGRYIYIYNCKKVSRITLFRTAGSRRECCGRFFLQSWWVYGKQTRGTDFGCSLHSWPQQVWLSNLCLLRYLNLHVLMFVRNTIAKDMCTIKQLWKYHHVIIWSGLAF